MCIPTLFLVVLILCLLSTTSQQKQQQFIEYGTFTSNTITFYQSLSASHILVSTNPILPIKVYHLHSTIPIYQSHSSIHILPFTSYQSHSTNLNLPITIYHSQSANHILPITFYQCFPIFKQTRLFLNKLDYGSLKLPRESQ